MCEFVGLNPTGGRSFWCFSKLKRLELAKYKVRGEGKGHYWKLAILFCRSFPLDHLPFLLLLFACLKIWIVFAVLFCFCCRVWVCVFMFLIYCWWANWTKYIALPTTTTASDAMFDMFTCNFTGVQHLSIFILPTALFVKLMACRLFLKLYFSILNVLHFNFYCSILYQCPFYFYLFYCKHFKSYNLFKNKLFVVWNVSKIVFY